MENLGGFMEQNAEGKTTQGNPGRLPRSLPFVLLLYLFVGAALGYLWERGSCDPLRGYHDWYVTHFDYTGENRHWLGTPIWKLPADMWIYQEIIYETKPDVLIDSGTYKGGSALYFASIFDLLKHGR